MLPAALVGLRVYALTERKRTTRLESSVHGTIGMRSAAGARGFFYSALLTCVPLQRHGRLSEGSARLMAGDFPDWKYHVSRAPSSS